MTADSLSQLPLFRNSSEDHLNTDTIRRREIEGLTLYSLVDIVGTFSDTETEARFYWRDTKKRLKEDGFELWGNISQLKLPSKDGKSYSTDVADAETCLRIVQSIPSPKAEPIRLWLAHLAHERLQEQAQPGLATDNARRREIDGLVRGGMSEHDAIEWLEQRGKGKQIRANITDEWKARGASGRPDYTRLTEDVNTVALGAPSWQVKRALALTEKDKLRDNLNAGEIATVSATEFFASSLHGKRGSQGVDELSEDVKDTKPIIDAARDAIKAAFSKVRPRNS